MNLKKYFSQRQKYIDSALDKLLPSAAEYPEKLFEAMRYSLFAGGKRIRPILMMAACEAVGGNKKDVLRPACAIEMIHTYSLIHDDLPAMDNDFFRRGKPTCHRAYGEAAAILAGDALLTEAFALMSQKEFVKKNDPDVILEVINDISTAAGCAGMVAGQMVDMELEGKDTGFAQLEFLHIHKTGALLLASIKVGAKMGGASPKRLNELIKYGKCIGLAFQIADDILDIEGKTEITGKDVGADKKSDKATYPRIVGIVESKKIANDLIEQALHSLSSFDKKADPLREIARYIVKREK